jgi:hypothetical protein
MLTETVYLNELRAAQARAVRKGMLLRKLPRGAGYSLNYAVGLPSTRPPMIFETFKEAVDELRMH